MNVTIDIGQPYSVEVLEKYAGTKHEREAVGMVLRRASDHIYEHIEPDVPGDHFAAVDLLDDLRAELGCCDGDLPSRAHLPKFRHW
jgi:hypothetical protein